MEELTQSNFKEKTGKGLSIVDYWAPWCGPCKMFGPIFEETSKDEKNKEIGFFKVNVDDNGELAQEANIRGIPTFVLYKDGVEVFRQSGLVAKEMLQSLLEEKFN